MNKKVIIFNKTRVLDKFFKVDEVKVSFERFDSKMSAPVTRFCFERGDSVAVIIFNRDTERIILVNQFRYPTYENGPGWITEAVAGMLERDEDAESAVRREVLEELGYTIESLEFISSFYVSPGGTSERIFLYFGEVINAGKVAPGGGKEGENENVSVQEFSIKEIDSLISKGMIQDAKTLLGLMWLQRRIMGASKEINNYIKEVKGDV